MANIVVIGAGMGGMSSAARLAALGHSVTIFEQSDTWGGKLGEETWDGHRFDTGPSLLTLPAVYRDLFLKTGRPLEESIDLVELDTAFRYQFADGTVLKMPGAGVGTCATAIGDVLGGASGDQWRAFLKRAASMWAVTRQPFLERPLDGMRSLLAMSWRLGDVKTIAPQRTLRSLAQHYFTDPRLVTLVDRYATYSGSDPRQAPAALATIPYVEETFGAHHVRGGLRELGRALYDRCVALGVTFQFGSAVEHIVVDTAVKSITTTDGQSVTCDIVIANVDAHVVYHQLLEDTLPAVRKAQHKLTKVTPSLSGFVINIALDEVTPGLEHHNVFFPENYDDEFDCIFGVGKSARPIPDPAIYICNPHDDRMAPAGKESWFVLVNAPRHVEDKSQGAGVNWNDSELVESYTNNIGNRLSDRGLDISSRILWSKTISPAELARRTGAPGGSIYGTSSNGMRAAFLRPANITDIPGLYLVGGSSHPGGGLPLVAMSAEIVSGHIGRA